ncbi:MAG TPA: response regulator [Bryobacteraceae bacterium]|nr:response regulator [Bryobacteraceae bacterium]
MPEQPRETILLVDDEPQVVELVREMLIREGYTVFGAGDGEEAIEFVEKNENHIDLLLTDIVMPQLNGRELADRLKDMRRGLRVLYMSGFMKEAILKYYGISITGIPFLQKPFTRETLARKVRDVLDAPATEAARPGR